MGAVANGIALHGSLIPVVGTFFVFADYMRPAIRLAALSRARVLFVFSHDSVGVGEDGPTHQPVEHLASLRVIPNLLVLRPADANETAHAFVAALEHDGPTALVLSRQNLPIVTDGSAVSKGAAVAFGGESAPDAVVVATGSEVSIALESARTLAADGVSVRVVSMPGVERFLSQPEELRRSLLPHGAPVLSVEAGSTFGWQRISDEAIGIDAFGTSAPGAVALAHYGITADAVTARIRRMLSK
jgi:transketolase